MRAELLPLKGKYYGTEVRLVDGADDCVVNIWFGGGAPSDRELGAYTREDWDANIEIDDGWGGSTTIQRDYIDWSHYESQRTLDVAYKILDAINGAGQ